MTSQPASKRPRSSEEDKILVVVKYYDSVGEESLHAFWSKEEDQKKNKTLFYQHLSSLGLVASDATDRGEFVPLYVSRGPALIHSGKTVLIVCDEDEDGAEDTSSDDE